MDEVVAPVLHNKVPVNSVAKSVELPQLFATSTPGAARDVGAEVPVPAALVHSLADAVTL